MKTTIIGNVVLRLLLAGCGWLSIGLGVAGLFLPLIPTVPFLLLAAACFARSSIRFHSWLMRHNHFGPLLEEYFRSGSIPLRAKQAAIGMIWVSVPTSAFLLLSRTWMKVVLLLVAAGVTCYLLRLPTTRAENGSAPLDPGSP